MVNRTVLVNKMDTSRHLILCESIGYGRRIVQQLCESLGLNLPSRSKEPVKHISHCSWAREDNENGLRPRGKPGGQGPNRSLSVLKTSYDLCCLSEPLFMNSEHFDLGILVVMIPYDRSL